MAQEIFSIVQPFKKEAALPPPLVIAPVIRGDNFGAINTVNSNEK